VPIVVDVHKEALVKRGYRDFADWAARPGHVYVGRNMSFYVKGAVASPWANPFSAKKHGRDECIAMYREWIKDRHDEVRHALSGALELGCWCAPEPCHADVLS
jgi:hypothetical protein